MRRSDLILAKILMMVEDAQYDHMPDTVRVFGKERQVSRDEWLCDHGIGHPIPGEDHHGNGIHGCDGCCIESSKEE